jgi:phage terminase large subunit
VNVREVKKGKGSVVSGINMVHELLKQNRLRIHKSCVNMIQAFEMYSYKETKGDQIPDEIPAHDYSDMLDALRYVIISNTSNSAFNGPKAHYSKVPAYGRSQINYNKFK